MIKAELVKNGATLRTLTFKYDPFGRRMEKKVVDNIAANTTIWNYLYDGDDIVQILESDATSTHTTHLTHGPGIDEPLAMVRDGVAYLYHADGLGSIVAISNDQGNIVNRYSYESFGMPTATNPEFQNAYTYTGREWDKEFGLYYYRARYYDPLEGRFISKDPIGFAGGDVNLYGYVWNNGINWVDPYGLSAWTWSDFWDGVRRRGNERTALFSAVVERGAKQIPKAMGQSLGPESFFAPLQHLRELEKLVDDKLNALNDCSDSDEYKKWEIIKNELGYGDSFIQNNGFLFMESLSAKESMARYERWKFERTNSWHRWSFE